MKRVVIIGKGNNWEKSPPLCTSMALDDRYECWGVNNVCLWRPVDLVFNMHDLEKHKDHKLFNKVIAHVNEYKIPMICQDHYEHIPTSMRFPIETLKIKYFTNSIDYMVAYAIVKQMRMIDIYGVVMGADTEYDKQRSSLHFWIGIAIGMGLGVRVNEPTYLLKDTKGLYGYDWDDEGEGFVKSREENQ
jgi:hypothetical protein